MWSRLLFALVTCLVSQTVSAAPASTLSVRYLNSELAMHIVTNAVHACTEKGYRVAAAFVNRDGTLGAFLRNPLAGPHTEKVAQRKAFSSATLQIATADMDTSNNLKFASDILMVKGGIPISIGGYFYGAVAVSGATQNDDHICAQTGIEAIRDMLEFEN